MINSAEKTKVVEVAAAVLQRPDGSFLLAQRPSDKIWAGHWEFPGGKVEVGETPYHALVRELHEELGIAVKTAYPWLTRTFTYPHATVRLNFFRVTAWQGEPHPHEGQEFSWQLAHEVRVTPLLPANAPIIRALELPPLYAISNAKELGLQEFMLRLESALSRGLRLIQLREKNMTRDELRALAQKMLPVITRHGARLLINSDIELAREVGAGGVHLNAAQLTSLRQRPEVPWCAASCHNAEELKIAEKLGCDFVVLSPVLPTLSHPGEAVLGWEGLSEIVKGCSIPVYALGGMTAESMELAWQHGAHGVALLRQAW